MFRVLSVFSLAVLAAYLMLRFSGTWADDLSAIYFAAYFAAQGETHLIYVAPGLEPTAWRAAAADLGVPDTALLPYLYPPIWAVLLAPLAQALPPMAFFDMSLWVLTAAAVICIYLAAGPARSDRARFRAILIGCVIVAGTQPGLLAFDMKQPQLIVIALCLGSLNRLEAGQSGRAGVLLGIAAALKILPVALALIFLIERDLRAMLGLLGTVGALTLANLLIAGPDLSMAFIDQLLAVDANLVRSTINYSLAPLLHQLSTDPFFAHSTIADRVDLVPRPAWIGTLSLVALIAGSIALVWRAAPLSAPQRRVLVFAVLGALCSLAAPLGWAHYYLLPLLLLPRLADVFPENRTEHWLVAGLLVHSLPYLPLAAPLNAFLPFGFLAPTLFWLGFVLRFTLWPLVPEGTARPRPSAKEG